MKLIMCTMFIDLYLNIFCLKSDSTFIKNKFIKNKFIEMEKRSNCVNVLTHICLRPGHGAPTYDVRKKKFTEHQLDHVQQAQVHKQYLYSEQLALFSSSELVGFGLV